MTQAERRIRRLELSGGDSSQLQQARYGLEEAFRTASLPGLPPNALVLIRRLDLGTIRPHQSAVQLADTIAETVRRLAGQAVCIDEQTAREAMVVWFSDPLQAYQCLLQQLLDGATVDEWYWRSLFPEQRLTLNESFITELLIKACQTPTNGLAVALLLQTCLAPLRLSRLLSLLTPAMARRVMVAQGLPPLTLSGSTTSIPRYAFSPAKTSPLIASPDLTQAWRSAINAAVAQWGEEDVRSRWLALQGLVCHRPGWLERRDLWQHIDVGAWLAAWSPSTPKAQREPHANTGQPLRLRRPNLAADDHETPQSMLATSRAQELIQPLRQHDQKGEISPEETVQADGHQTSSQAATMSGRFSRDAGFGFLIPLLQRLGMAELLAQHEALLIADFPRQLLRTMATRFGLGEIDPARCFLAETELTVNLVINDVEVPLAWQHLLATSPRVSRHVALPVNTLRLDELLNYFQLVCAVFLRRHCALSMRGLIRRPGWVTLGRNHWDVQFDLQQTDLRLRRLALDSNPGWVPWLGRVVQFHYDEGRADVP